MARSARCPVRHPRRHCLGCNARPGSRVQRLFAVISLSRRAGIREVSPARLALGLDHPAGPSFRHYRVGGPALPSGRGDLGPAASGRQPAGRWWSGPARVDRPRRETRWRLPAAADFGDSRHRRIRRQGERRAAVPEPGAAGARLRAAARCAAVHYGRHLTRSVAPSPKRLSKQDKCCPRAQFRS